jgi:hypothetical protein
MAAPSTGPWKLPCMTPTCSCCFRHALRQRQQREAVACGAKPLGEGSAYCRAIACYHSHLGHCEWAAVLRTRHVILAVRCNAARCEMPMCSLGCIRPGRKVLASTLSSQVGPPHCGSHLSSCCGREGSAASSDYIARQTLPLPRMHQHYCRSPPEC